MKPEDLTVEVRDRNLNRVGVILPRDLDLKATIRWAGVGDWTLKLPQDHTMAAELRKPGSGIVVTGPVGQVHRAPVFSLWSGAARNLAPAIVGGGTWAEVRRNYFKPSMTLPARVGAWSGETGVTTYQGAEGVVAERSSEGGGEWVLRSSTSDVLAFAVGDQVSASATVKNHSAWPLTVRLALSYSYNSGVYAQSESVILESGETRDIKATGVATSTNTSRLAVRTWGGSGFPLGSKIELIGSPTVEKGSPPYGQFSGSTMDESMIQPKDFRVRWLGAENNSESVMEIEQVRGLVGVGAIAGASTRDGKPAVRVIATSPIGAPRVHFTIPVGSPARSGATVLSTLHVGDATRTGGHLSNPSVGFNSPVSNSPAMPSVAPGVYPLRKTLLEAILTPFQAHWYALGFSGSADVWWTDIGLFAGDYDGPWFGIDTPGDELTRYVQDGTVVVKQTRTLVTPAYTEILTGTVFSGPRTPAKQRRDQKDPDGTLEFSGVTDDILLDDALAYPQPGNADPNTQNKSNDVRTGKTETLMRQYVAFNITPLQGAPGRGSVGLRSKLSLQGSDQSRGVNTSKSPRFQNLLELLQELAVEGTLGFRVVQEGSGLKFEVVPVRDLRATIRLDLENGTITSEELQDQGPTLTYAIVAGQGEGVERQMVVRARPDSATEESDWGRRIERFYDRRDTDNVLELQAKGDEELAMTGAGVAIKLVPSDDQTMRYLIDWNVGDWVTAVVNGVETWSVVTEAVIVAHAGFTGVGVSIGDVTSFTPEGRSQSQGNKNDSRIGYLERAAVGPVGIDRLPAKQLSDLATPVGSVVEWYATSTPGGWLRLEGQAISRTTYSELFALIGVTFGAGDGTTTFNLPDRRGRAGVGVSSDTEFNALGKMFGTKTHTLTTAQIPAHSHTRGFVSGWAIGAGQSGKGVGQDSNVYPSGVSTADTGGGEAHNNIQPSIAAYYIMKVQ